MTADCGYAHSAAVSEHGALFTWGPATGEVVDEDDMDEDDVPAGLGHDDLDDKLAPTLVAPDHLLGARIGRGLPLEPLLAVAFAMGTHGRLGAGEAAAGEGPGDWRKSRRVAGKEPLAEEGAGSAVMALAGEPGLVKMVVELCGDGTEGWGAGEVGEGVMRLAGAGRSEGRTG